MTPAAWLRDLIAWSLQLGLLVAAAALLARLLPLRPPGVALAYWQALLLACLALPLGQPRQEPPAPLLAPEQSLRPAAPAVAHVPTSYRPQWLSERNLLLALGAGVALRGGWIGIGLWRLRCLRRSSRRLPEGLASLERAQQRVGVRADFYSSELSDVPITFGLRRPAVLLPEAVLAMPQHAQQAILCHELLHVRRRDWPWAVAEECAKALLWFHPAIAWLIGRIQLVREQAVDRAVVAITGSREDYVGALLAVAQAKAQPRLYPAPPFLRRGRLKQRVAEILQEGTMSRRRLVFHFLASAGAVALALAGAVRLFPLEARAAGSEPVQVLRGSENLLHGERMEYPRRALERKVAGELLLEISLDERGQVQDARVLSGPDELRAAALQSVLRWHYAAPASLPASQQVLLQFTLPAEGPEPAGRQRAEMLPRQIEEPALQRKLHELQEREAKAMAEQQRMLEKLREAEQPLGSRLTAIHAARLAPEAQQALLAQLGVAVGDTLDEAALARVRAAVARFDEHVVVKVGRAPGGGLILLLVGP